MEFRKYQHIERFGTSEVEYIEVASVIASRRLTELIAKYGWAMTEVFTQVAAIEN